MTALFDRDDHAAIAADHQDDILQLLVGQHVGDILNMGVQIDVWTGQLHSLTVTGQGGSTPLIAGDLQPGVHT